MSPLINVIIERERLTNIIRQFNVEEGIICKATSVRRKKFFLSLAMSDVHYLHLGLWKLFITRMG